MATIETSPPESTCVQPLAAKAAFTEFLMRSTHRGSWVWTFSHEYVLYWPKFALRSLSVFTCCANYAAVKKKSIAFVTNRLCTILIYPSVVVACYVPHRISKPHILFI